MVGDFSQEPLNSQVLVYKGGGELPVEGFCECHRTGVNDFFFCTQDAHEEPVAQQVSSAVGAFKEIPSLVLRIHTNMQLDVLPVQQLDGRVEQVVLAALVSF